MVQMLHSVFRLQLLRQPWRDQTLAVEFRDLNIHVLFHTGISADCFLRTVVIHGDGLYLRDDGFGIVHHDDPPLVQKAAAVNPSSPGEEQTIVGIELAELAMADGHIQHHSFAKLPVHILPDEAELGIAAHAGGAFKGDIPGRLPVDHQRDSLRVEHQLRLLL